MDRRADDQRLHDLAERVGKIEQGLVTNTALTNEVHKNTTAIVEAWTAISGGMKVLGWLGHAAKWIAAFLAAIAAIYAAWHSGVQPPTSVHLPK